MDTFGTYLILNWEVWYLMLAITAKWDHKPRTHTQVLFPCTATDSISPYGTRLDGS